MRSRLATLTLGLYLTLALFACTSKPTQTSSTDNNQMSGTSSTDSTGSNSNNSGNMAGGGAMNKSDKKSSMADSTPPAPTTATIPAGTIITVRLGESVGSKTSQPGQSFSATVASAVQVDGNTVIPAGATASGVVVDAKPLGRFKGGAVLQLKLTSINVHGGDASVETSSVVRTATGKGKRTGAMIGGGAGLGAIVGAIAGGGKGAAIGALAGAGAGTAGTAFTGNKDIVLPAESALSFKLEQPLVVKL
jgi:hypothetical protein